MEREHAIDANVPQPTHSVPETAHPVIPTALEQVIERKSASFSADVQALRLELHQHMDATVSQATDLRSGPLEQQKLSSGQLEPLALGASDLEGSSIPGPSARSLSSGQGPPHQVTRSAEPTTWRQGQQRVFEWLEGVWLPGQVISYRRIVVIWIVCLLLGLVIGTLIAFAMT